MINNLREMWQILREDIHNGYNNIGYEFQDGYTYEGNLMDGMLIFTVTDYSDMTYTVIRLYNLDEFIKMRFEEFKSLFNMAMHYNEWTPIYEEEEQNA